MTLVFVAALLCVKLAGPSASSAPSQATRELAVRELLTAKQDAMVVKTSKMSAVKAAAALASKHSSIKKSVQKLEEEAPAAEADEVAPTEEAPAAEEPAVSAEAPAQVESPAVKVGEEEKDGGSRFHNDGLEPGWDKSGWSSGEWASWIITGPLISIALSFFMFYTYGVPASALSMIICAVIDVTTFYYNW